MVIKKSELIHFGGMHKLCLFMRDLKLPGVYFKNSRYVEKDQVRDGEHENKMQASFAVKGFCVTGFIN